MNLLSWRVLSMALLVAVALGMPTVTNAQEAQPMNEISLGSGTWGGAAAGSVTGGASLDGGNVGGSEQIAPVSTAGPEAVAFDGTYVGVATQFNNSITRVRVSDGAVTPHLTQAAQPGRWWGLTFAGRTALPARFAFQDALYWIDHRDPAPW